MVLGEYGVTALVGKFLDFFYLVVAGFVDNAATFVALGVGLVAVILLGVFITVMLGVTKAPVDGLNSILRSLKRM